MGLPVAIFFVDAGGGMAPRPGMPGTNPPLPNLGNCWFLKADVLCFSFVQKIFLLNQWALLGAQSWKLNGCHSFHVIAQGQVCLRACLG